MVYVDFSVLRGKLASCARHARKRAHARPYICMPYIYGIGPCPLQSVAYVYLHISGRMPVPTYVCRTYIYGIGPCPLQSVAYVYLRIYIYLSIYLSIHTYTYMIYMYIYIQTYRLALATLRHTCAALRRFRTSLTSTIFIFQ